MARLRLLGMTRRLDRERCARMAIAVRAGMLAEGEAFDRFLDSMLGETKRAEKQAPREPLTLEAGLKRVAGMKLPQATQAATRVVKVQMPEDD